MSPRESHSRRSTLRKKYCSIWVLHQMIEFLKFWPHWLSKRGAKVKIKALSSIPKKILKNWKQKLEFLQIMPNAADPTLRSNVYVWLTIFVEFGIFDLKERKKEFDFWLVSSSLHTFTYYEYLTHNMLDLKTISLFRASPTMHTKSDSLKLLIYIWRALQLKVPYPQTLL